MNSTSASNGDKHANAHAATSAGFGGLYPGGNGSLQPR
jgi:hypothetical protein